MDSFWIAVLVAGAVWFFWLRPKPSPSPSADSIADPDTDEHDEVTEDEEPDRAVVRDARRLREALERRERADLDNHHRSMAGVREKLARARQYITDAGLDRDIPDVWDSIRHWSSWVRLPDGRWTAPEGVSGITGRGDYKDIWVAWLWGNHSYRLRFAEKANYLPDDYDRCSEITLEVDEEAVCTISCSKGPESYSNWRFTGVDALVVGRWITEFVRFAAFLRADRDASTRATFADFDREKASRMKLDE